MDSQYGIAVTNKFCLFDDDDEVDPYEILKQEEQKRNEALAKEKADKSKTNKKSKKSAPQENKSKTVEQNIQKKEDKPNQSQARPRQNERPPRSARQVKENREQQEERRPRRLDENNISNEPREKPEGGFSSGRMESRGGFSGRPRGRGGPRGRGNRGGFGGGFGGKREYERHSGSDRTSGVKPMEKKDGSGAHNWGTFKDELDEEASKENEEPKEWNQGEDAENQDPNESTESTEQQVSEGDKAPKQLTLDEWKAMEEKKRVKADFKLRKANEGTDPSQWKGSVYRKPTNESDEEEEEEEEYEEEDDHKMKHQVPIRITFNDSPRRGGRGGGRRPRGGRGPRGTPGRGDGRRNPRDSAPRFDDEADFPSLVKSAA